MTICQVKSCQFYLQSLNLQNINFAPFEVVSGRASGATSSQHCGTVCTYHSITCIDSGEEKCVYVLINSLIKSMQSISHVAANAAVTFHWLVLGGQWLVYTFT